MAERNKLFRAGDVQSTLSTDDVTTLRSVAAWIVLINDLKSEAWKDRDEWKALCAIRLELGIALCGPEVARRYLHLSAREIEDLDRRVSEHIGRPLRFCTVNYRQPLKPRGSTRRRWAEGKASESLRRKIHAIDP
jgi:hypothetical protein